MNERIKELIKSSGGISHDDDGKELTPILVGSNLEHFAYLIVLEFARILLHYTDVDEGVAVAKKHFGVE